MDSLDSGGVTDLHPGMATAGEMNRRSDAKIKHLIVLSDGQTPEKDIEGLTRQLADEAGRGRENGGAFWARFLRGVVRRQASRDGLPADEVVDSGGAYFSQVSLGTSKQHKRFDFLPVGVGGTTSVALVG
jgi:hypothetical protein